MNRLNIIFNTNVPTLHSFILTRLLSVLSILGLVGISVTVASQGVSQTSALSNAAVANVANLDPILSSEAQKALTTANIDPSAAITGFAPVFSDEAKEVLELANIHPDTTVTSVFVPKQLDPAANALDLAKAMHDHVSTQFFDRRLSQEDALATDASLFVLAKPAIPGFRGL